MAEVPPRYMKSFKKNIILLVLTVFCGLQTSAAQHDPYTAAWIGDLESVREAVRNKPAIVHATGTRGPDVLQMQTKGALLHYAAKGGHLEVVTYLLQQGAKVDALDADKETALHHALGWGNSTVALFLLEEAADVNRKTDFMERTALHIAIDEGLMDCAEIILKQASDINARDTNEDTPLHLAALNGFDRLVEALIRRGAKVNIRDRNGRTPIHEAADRGSLKICQNLLAAGADLQICDHEGLSPVDEAILSGNRELAGFLLRRGGKLGDPIHQAVGTGNIEEVRRIIAKDSQQAVVRNKSGFRPIHLASAQGYTQILKVLLDAGANIDDLPETDKVIRMTTPLGLASRAGKKKAAEFLVERGADVSKLGRNKFTPLHETLKNGHLELAALLIECGADVDVREDGRLSPLRFAVILEEKFPGATELLLESGADPNPGLMWAAHKGDIKTLKLLFTKGADLNQMTRMGTPIIESPIFAGDSETVLWLLENGLDPNLTNQDAGWSGLHIAAGICNPESASITAALIRHGARVDLRGKKGATALHVAAWTGNLAVAEILLDHGADVNAKWKDGSHPLDVAATDEMEKLLALRGGVRTATDSSGDKQQ